jgi:transcriptional regulator with XRE-family HTH domain
MNPVDLSNLLGVLAERRKVLGMTLDALVIRSGVPRATVCRILAGHLTVSFQHIFAVADALGVTITFAPSNASEFLEQQAERQATRLVNAVQSTMALENQAVDVVTTKRMIEQTKNDLLKPSKAKDLWID